MRLDVNTDALIDYRFQEFQRRAEIAEEEDKYFEMWCEENEISEEKQALRREFENDPDGFVKEGRWGL
jgi:hypothetical protein